MYDMFLFYIPLYGAQSYLYIFLSVLSIFGGVFGAGWYMYFISGDHLDKAPGVINCVPKILL